MSVVDIDRTKPFTKETGFAILSIVGLAAEELRGLLSPEEVAEFTAWEQRNAVQGKEPPPEYTRGPCF